MQIDVASSLPRGSGLRRVAFLHEAADPSAGSPPGVRAELTQACRSAGFRGKEKEIASVAGKDGGWVLVGLGRAPSSIGRLRRAVRRTAKEALRPGTSRIAFVFGKGLEDAEIRCLLPQLAALDYRFDRYRSRAADPAAAARRRGTLLLASEPSRRRLSAAAREAGIVAEAAAWARDLGNTPANDLGRSNSPARCARWAAAMA